MDEIIILSGNLPEGDTGIQSATRRLYLSRPIALDETQQDFGETFLGKIGQNFKEKALYKTRNGFNVEPHASSAGYTGVHVIPHQGVEISVLRVDPKNPRQPIWEPQQADRRDVVVAKNWGKLVNQPETGPRLWKQEEIGNEGIRAGVIRVIIDGEIRYYAIGAKFRGKPDDYYVETKMVEVQLIQPELQAPEDGLTDQGN